MNFEMPSSEQKPTESLEKKLQELEAQITDAQYQVSQMENGLAPDETFEDFTEARKRLETLFAEREALKKELN